MLLRIPGSNSESDSESITDNNANSELQFLAERIAAAPVVLEKSQVPQVKKRKDEAITIITKRYEATFGKPLDSKVFLKKMNNMKSRLKKKTDLKKTGNKLIKLLEWEKQLLKAMEGDNNPTIGRIRGAMHIGIDEGGCTQQKANETTTERRESETSTNRKGIDAFAGQESTSTMTVQALPPKKNRH